MSRRVTGSGSFGVGFCRSESVRFGAVLGWVGAWKCGFGCVRAFSWQSWLLAALASHRLSAQDQPSARTGRRRQCRARQGHLATPASAAMACRATRTPTRTTACRSSKGSTPSTSSLRFRRIAPASARISPCIRRRPTLTDQDMQDIAAFFSGKPLKPNPAIAGQGARGRAGLRRVPRAGWRRHHAAVSVARRPARGLPRARAARLQEGRAQESDHGDVRRPD